MDPKYFKRQLGDDPSESEYLYWKNMLTKFIDKAKIPIDEKLDALLSLCGHQAFPLVEDCTTFENAIQRLDKKFSKSSSAIMTRHKLRSQKQGNESVEEFLNSLHQLAKKCHTPALSAEQHRQMLIVDAFISGLSSSTIRQRLLESEDDTLDNLTKIAITMELSIKDAQSLSSSVPSSSFTVSSAVTQNKCWYCGGRPHKSRSNCPARDSFCNICQKKGHWAPVCRSSQYNNPSTYITRKTIKASSLTAEQCHSSEEKDEDDVCLSSTLAVCTIPSHKSSCKTQAAINGIPITGLIDTGADNSFVEKSFLIKNSIPFDQNTNRHITLANNSTFVISGKLLAKVTIGDYTYNNLLLMVTDSLVSPLIIGRDILGQHSQIAIHLGGWDKQATFCAALKSLQIEPPTLLPGVEVSKIKPIATPSRPNQRHSQFIASEITRLLRDDIIQESTSPWRAQCFVTNSDSKPRLVIDFSGTINKYTPLDAYPPASIDKLVATVAKHSVFSKLDLRSAYHQVPLRPRDFHLTAFEALGKLYEFKRLPFGCTNAVPIFQRIMNSFIEDNNLTGSYSYLDDIIICGRNQEEHDYRLQQFLESASKFGMQFNNDKCQFSQRQICFLGHIIEEGSLRPDPMRFQNLMDFPEPKTLSQLNRLIGLFAYYAKWMQRSSELIQSLTQARETIKFSKLLPQKAKMAIADLKLRLRDATLAPPDYDQPLQVETDASENAIGATLSQKGRPIAFLSRALSHSERKQSIIEREAAAIIEAVRRWRSILHAVPTFNIITDQRSVSFLFNPSHKSKIKSEKLARWRLDLAEFRYTISYRPGKNNTCADTLSRCNALKDTTHLKTLHDQLCHPGESRLHHYCRSMNLSYTLAEIRSTINSCTVCKEVKPKFFKPPRGKLILATRPWERLSMDFIGPLPSASKNKYILVVIDEYSRFPFAFACQDMTSETVITNLLMLFSMFGSPSAIHSDRGTQFEGIKLKEFLLRNGIVKSRTTPYSPQANGQCERANGTLLRTIKLALRNFKSDKVHWEDVLQLALSSMRSLLCTATNDTPHNRFFKFQRQSAVGTSIPPFLMEEGTSILHRKRNCLKGDLETEPVILRETISPHFARVQFPQGRVDTVSTRDLAPSAGNNIKLVKEENSPQPSERASPPVSEDNQTQSTESDTTVPDTNEQNTSSSGAAEPKTTHTSRGREVRLPVRFNDYL